MIKGVLLDLDGTVYRGHDEVPGAARFIADLRAMGVKHLFVTNRANRTPAKVCEHLSMYGIACGEDDVLTSAQATVQHLAKGTVFYIGEEGMREALDRAGFPVVEENPDYVIVSFDRSFNYATMKRACRMIRAGARFVATNPDKCLNTEKGIVPGTGAIVAAIAAGCGVEPLVIGKPEARIFETAMRRLGVPREQVIAVGDSLATDIPAGHNAGIRTVFMVTGVSTREELARSPVQPTWICDTYDQLSALIAAENGDAPASSSGAEARSAPRSG
jgi:HAD superfamily hydrolase (TIGR01457 family)